MPRRVETSTESSLLGPLSLIAALLALAYACEQQRALARLQASLDALNAKKLTDFTVTPDGAGGFTVNFE